MVLSLKELTEQVLKLPIEDRARLNDILTESLSKSATTEEEKQLVAELSRRRDEVRSGAVQPIDGEQVLAEGRRMVGL